MAKKQEEQQQGSDDKPPESDVPKAAATQDEGLVEVLKDGELLKVHPSTVAAHLAAGWKVAG